MEYIYFSGGDNMEKRNFDCPEMEITHFGVEDVITASNDYCPVNIVDPDELPPIPVG